MILEIITMPMLNIMRILLIISILAFLYRILYRTAVQITMIVRSIPKMKRSSSSPRIAMVKNALSVNTAMHSLCSTSKVRLDSCAAGSAA